MIYLIDDKKSRQENFGWTDERLAHYADMLMPIRNADDLQQFQEDIYKADNVIIFHESFLSSSDKIKQESINTFKANIQDNNLKVCTFSGSKNTRTIDGNTCMLPVDVVYENLSVFLNKFKDGDFNFQYLAFGENYEIEESLRNRIENVINDIKNVNPTKIDTSSRKVFCATFDNDFSIVYPFTEVVETEYFFPEDNFSDAELNEIVNTWFSTTKYDVIYIPLCFGNTLSDFLGLRLAMHIVFSKTENRFSHIYICGDTTFSEICRNECFDVLKIKSVKITKFDAESLRKTFNNISKLTEEEINHSINSVNLSIPWNLGDNHNVANVWAIYRWCEMLDWKEKTPDILDSKLTKSLYFKYLCAKFGEHDKFKKDKKRSPKISNIEGKTIAYIDDEYDKGWENILRNILEKHSNAKLVCFNAFDKKLSKHQLLDKIKEFVDNTDADCFVLDLRLHEKDFSTREKLSGHTIAEYIKEQNAGNQIVVFTASNKIWNLKEVVFKIGAVGYALKESPEMNLKRDGSAELFMDFAHALSRACSMSFLKRIVETQQKLKTIDSTASQLDDAIELMNIDKGNRSQALLSSVLLIELAYLEYYIKEVKEFYLLEEGQETSTKLFLCCKKDNQMQIMLTNHLFVKRRLIDDRSNVCEMSVYSNNEKEPDSGWGQVSNSDAIIVSSAMLLHYNLSLDDIKLYFELKTIRNTQIAHYSGTNNNPDNLITIDMITKLYHNIISKIILSKL